MAIIDSLFHKYYVPPVVFAISKDPIDGYETLDTLIVGETISVPSKKNVAHTINWGNATIHW
jgi:hypothetical protein